MSFSAYQDHISLNRILLGHIQIRQSITGEKWLFETNSMEWMFLNAAKAEHLKSVPEAVPELERTISNTSSTTSSSERNKKSVWPTLVKLGSKESSTSTTAFAWPDLSTSLTERVVDVPELVAIDYDSVTIVGEAAFEDLWPLPSASASRYQAQQTAPYSAPPILMKPVPQTPSNGLQWNVQWLQENQSKSIKAPAPPILPNSTSIPPLNTPLHALPHKLPVIRPPPQILRPLLKELQPESRAALESTLRYKFRHPSTLWTALQTSPNHIRIDGLVLPKANREMALYGDKVLALALADHWFFDTDLSLCEGHYLIQNRATNAYLAECGFKAGLEPYANYSRKGNAKLDSYVMATMVEALLAAVHIDSKSVAIVKRAMVGLGLINGDFETDCTKEKSFGSSGEKDKKPSMLTLEKSAILWVEIEAVKPVMVFEKSAMIEKVTVSEPKMPAATLLEVGVVEAIKVLEKDIFVNSVLSSDPKSSTATVLETAQSPPQATKVDSRVEDVVSQPSASVSVSSQEQQPAAKEKKSRVRRLKEKGLGWLEKKIKKRCALKT